MFIKATTLLVILMASFLTFTPSALSNEHPKPDPLAQIRAEHVMISTDDYDGTIRWYREKLGFRLKHEWTVRGFAGVRLAYIELNGFIVEVVGTETRYQEKRQPDNLADALTDRGFGHLAFLVADVDAAAAELQRRGVDLVIPPTTFPSSGRRVTFIRDNNGNFIELLTPLAAYEARQPR